MRLGRRGVRLYRVHARASRKPVIRGLTGWAGRRTGLCGGGENLHGGVWVRRVAGLCILRVQEQLSAQIAGWWRVAGAPRMSDETALLAQHSTFLDALETNSADDG